MAVHEAGIVHGDLKLDNVLWDGDHQRPLLCDFGLAKELSQNTGDTLAGAGTAYFMSPERLQQRSGRSMEDDVWAFGCLMAQVSSRSSCLACRYIYIIFVQGTATRRGALGVRYFAEGGVAPFDEERDFRHSLRSQRG